jgi:phage FluMu protein Com
MEKQVTCTTCRKHFYVVGDGRTGEISRPITCPRCREQNEVDWPADGTYAATAEQLDVKAMLNQQARRAAKA